MQSERAKTQLSPEANVLVRDHMHIAQRLARATSRRLPSHIAYDDVLSAGLLGLVQAACSYSPAKGVPFAAFAENRVLGEIRDDLRRRDALGRGTRCFVKEVEMSTARLTSTLGRAPTTAEVATNLNRAPAWVEGVLVQRSRAQVADRAHDLATAVDTLPEPEHGPEEHAIDEERRSCLSEAVQCLSERLRQVVTAHYFHGLSMDEVAAQMGISRSRACQMHREALDLLADGMNSQLDPASIDLQHYGPVVAGRRASYIDRVTCLHAAQRRVQRSSTAGCSRLRPTNCSTLLTVA